MSKSLLILLAAAGAAERETGWLLLLGGASNDAGFGVAVDGDGNSFIAGATQSEGSGGWDAHVAKVDPDGAVLWQKRWGSAQADYGLGAAYYPTTDRVLIVGQTAHSGNTGATMRVLEASNGADVGTRRLVAASSVPVFYGAMFGSDGFAYACGSGIAASSGTDIIIAKFSAGGTLQWQRRLYGPTTTGDNSFRGAIDSGDNLLIPGNAAGVGTGGLAVLAKYTGGGTLSWQRTADGGASDTWAAAAVDASDNCFVGGYSDTAGVFGCIVAKYNSSGTIQWQRKITGLTQCYFEGAACDADGNAYFCGQSNEPGSTVGLLAKYDTNGVLQWLKSITPPSGTLVLVQVACFGETLKITGNTTGDGAGLQDILLLSIPTSGNLNGIFSGFAIGDIVLTEAAGTLTEAAGTLTSATPSMTSSAYSHTTTTATLTAELIPLE